VEWYLPGCVTGYAMLAEAKSFVLHITKFFVWVVGSKPTFERFGGRRDGDSMIRIVIIRLHSVSFDGSQLL
jgi:hypothetical protein